MAFANRKRLVKQARARFALIERLESRVVLDGYAELGVLAPTEILTIDFDTEVVGDQSEVRLNIAPGPNVGIANDIVIGTGAGTVLKESPEFYGVPSSLADPSPRFELEAKKDPGVVNHILRYDPDNVEFDNFVGQLRGNSHEIIVPFAYNPDWVGGDSISYTVSDPNSTVHPSAAAPSFSTSGDSLVRRGGTEVDRTVLEDPLRIALASSSELLAVSSMPPQQSTADLQLSTASASSFAAAMVHADVVEQVAEAKSGSSQSAADASTPAVSADQYFASTGQARRTADWTTHSVASASRQRVTPVFHWLDTQTSHVHVPQSSDVDAKSDHPNDVVFELPSLASVIASIWLNTSETFSDGLGIAQRQEAPPAQAGETSSLHLVESGQVQSKNVSTDAEDNAIPLYVRYHPISVLLGVSLVSAHLIADNQRESERKRKQRYREL